ncbi:MAG: hypothetical protein AAGA68_10190 [Pseudomonadota bacterium]
MDLNHQLPRLRSIGAGLALLLGVALGASQALAQERDLTFRISGTLNGEFLQSAPFRVPIRIDDVGDPDTGTDIIVTGTLPDPEQIFPGASVPLEFVQRIIQPPLDYIPPIFCAIICQDPLELDPCAQFCVNPTPNDSPEGIDEVFVARFDNGDVHLGITDFQFEEGVVSYQFNARFQSAAPNFTTVGVIDFPATREPGAPIRPAGDLTVSTDDGATTRKLFDGLVTMKNRDAILVSGFTKGVTVSFDGLDFRISADIRDTAEGFTLLPPNPGEAGQANDFTTIDGSLGSQVALYFGTSEGESAVVVGACSTNLLMDNARLLGLGGDANLDGVVTITRNVPEAASDQTLLLQALDLSDCDTSNLVINTF